jgi:type IV pilus assembly protein PilV
VSYKPYPNSSSATQRGITLIESLIALLILALGVLGLAQVEARMLVETRTTNSRSTAIRLIADLRERIRLNTAGAQPALSSNGRSLYADSNPPGAAGSFPAPPSNSTDCNPVTAATPQQQVTDDLCDWRKEIAQSLMNGRASIWQVSPQQLQVIVAWQPNENTNTTFTGTAENQQLSDQLQITNASTKANLCADDTHSWICHIDFIDISATQ